MKLRHQYDGMICYYTAVLVYTATLNILGCTSTFNDQCTCGRAGCRRVSGDRHHSRRYGTKNTASFVSTEVTNSSGWSNDGVSWQIGLLSTVYPVLGYDSACHLSEEMPRASRNVPVTMIGSVSIDGILGLVFCIVILFATGPLEILLATPTGFTFMQIFLDTTKSATGATVLSAILTVVAIAATAAGITSTSRIIWTFAHDKALPFDRYFSFVSRKSQIPVRAVVAVPILQMLVGFICMGNTTTFNAVLSMAILGLYASYTIPIAYFMIFGQPDFTARDYGVFKMPKTFGLAINLLGCAWLILAMVFSTFPTSMPLTPQNMNYSTMAMVG